MQQDDEISILYGLRVSAPFALGVPCSDVAIDLALQVEAPRPIVHEIPNGTLIARSPGRGEFVTALVTDDSGFLLRIREFADVRISADLKFMCYTPAPGTGRDHLRDLSATIFSAFLSLAGSAVLHGSAVCEVPALSPLGGAVAFVGGSGSGKSTWAAQFCRIGAAFITDDALPICLADSRPAVVGGCSELRLREGAETLSDCFSGKPMRVTVDERIAISLGSEQSYPVPLEAILLLQPEEGESLLQLDRLSGSGVALMLAGMQRTNGWAVPNVQRAYFETIMDIAEKTPVFKVSYSHEIAPSESSADELAYLVKGALNGR